MTELQEIQLVYDIHAACQVKAHNVGEPLVADFSLRLRKVLSSLNRDEAFTFLKPLRYYRYLLTASVLPVNHPQLYPTDTLKQLERQRKQVAASYPRMVADFDALIESLALLELHEQAPLLSHMNEIAGEASALSRAILIREAPHLPLVQETLKQYWRGLLPPEVVTLQRPKELRCFDHLFVAGPISDYPAHVLQAPRARHLDIVRYTWTQDEVRTGSLFVKPVLLPMEREVISIRSTGTELHELTFDLEELRPVVDVGSLAQQYGTHNHKEIVEARLVVLEGGSGVFLELGDTVFTANPALAEHDRIERVALASLAEGDYLILRTEGGGDLVAKVADGIMGKHAPILRQRQEEWKGRLREQVGRQGTGAVAHQLTSLGARYADATNIRHWMARRSLGPGTDGDFRTVLMFVGLGDSIDDYRQALQNLRKAHSKAGHEIRRRLIKQLGRSDMEPLEREGFMEVTLPEEHGGSLSIYRIASLPRQTARVSYKNIGRIIAIGG